MVSGEEGKRSDTGKREVADSLPQSGSVQAGGGKELYFWMKF